MPSGGKRLGADQDTQRFCVGSCCMEGPLTLPFDPIPSLREKSMGSSMRSVSQEPLAQPPFQPAPLYPVFRGRRRRRADDSSSTRKHVSLIQSTSQWDSRIRSGRRAAPARAGISSEPRPFRRAGRLVDRTSAPMSRGGSAVAFMRRVYARSELPSSRAEARHNLHSMAFTGTGLRPQARDGWLPRQSSTRLHVFDDLLKRSGQKWRQWDESSRLLAGAYKGASFAICSLLVGEPLDGGSCASP